MFAPSEVYATHNCCISWRWKEEAKGLSRTLKPLAYACRNGGRDKGEVGRKWGRQKEERVNVKVLNKRSYCLSLL